MADNGTNGWEIHIRKLLNNDYELSYYVNGERQRPRSEFYGTLDKAISRALAIQKDNIKRRIHTRVSFGPSVHRDLAERLAK